MPSKLHLMKYAGSKQSMIPWLYRFFCQHRTFVDVFGGAANITLNKRPSQYEVLNDLDRLLVNLYDVIRNPALRAELATMLEATLRSEENYERATKLCWEAHLKPGDPPNVELAWAKFMAHQLAFGGGFGRCFGRYASGGGSEWVRRVMAVADRLSHVTVECGDWRWVIDKYDRPDVLHFIDPPYIEGVSKKVNYVSEQGQRFLTDIAAKLKTIKGKFLLCSFPTPTFDAQGWYRIEMERKVSIARERVGRTLTEVVWANYPLSPELEETRLERWRAGGDKPRAARKAK